MQRVVVGRVHSPRQFVFTNLTPSAFNDPWQSLACSADTTVIVAGGAQGAVYSSRDGGFTWTQATNLPVGQYFSCYVSADGHTMVATAENLDQPFLSTNAGLNWMQLTNNGLPSPGDYTYSVTLGSTNGENLLVADFGSYVYRSTDGGMTWARGGTVPSAFANDYWVCGACSANGSTVMLGTSGAGFILSTDFGGHWTTTGAPSGPTWNALACNAAGTLWLAGELGNGTISNGNFVGGALYISPDTGTTWNKITNSPLGGWQGVAMTPDGKEMAAANRFAGALWISLDAGTTWSIAPVPTDYNWDAVAFSADGNQVLAAPYRPPIVRGTWTAQLGISATPTNATLSWLAPANGFVLQQSTSLQAPAWTNVNATANVVAGSNTVTLNLASQRQFFRLRHP